MSVRESSIATRPGSPEQRTFVGRCCKKYRTHSWHSQFNHKSVTKSVKFHTSISIHKLQRMAHRYIIFPPNGPLDNLNRPLGMCECGRWKNDAPSADPCPNALSGKCVFHPANNSHHLYFYMLLILCCFLLMMLFHNFCYAVSRIR